MAPPPVPLAPSRGRSPASRDQQYRRQLVADARQRARHLGWPTLLRVHRRLPRALGQDAWAGWNPGGGTGVLWNDGRRREQVAAWDTLSRWPLPGDRPAAAAQALLARLLGQVFDAGWTAADTPLADVPLAFCALGFDGEAGAWEDWEPGCLWLPRLQRSCFGGRQARRGVQINAWVAADSDVEQTVDALEAAADSIERPGGAPAAHPLPADGPGARSLESPASWRARVAAARDALKAGGIEKVVLARTAQFVAPAGAYFCPRATAWALRDQHPASTTYLWQHHPGRALVGASPETLVAVRGRRLATQALAGTAPRDPDPTRDAAHARALLASAKDRREHQVVVDMLRAALAPWCHRLRLARRPRVTPLPQLQHLDTPVDGTLRQAGGILAIAADLHPTPAVCGWPTPAARSYLRAHEPLARGWYAGPIGWLTAAGDGCLAVALRAARLSGDQAQSYAGAGIVAASDPAAEWDETELKLAAIGRGLRLGRR